MNGKKIGIFQKQDWRWLFPVLFLAFLVGIAIPLKAYVQSYTQFSLRPIQILPTIAVCFITALAVGVGVGLLILNWQRVKEKLGDYWFLVIGAFVALFFVIFAQNKLPGPALLFTGLLAGLLVRKWEHKYVYLIYGTALVVGIAAFIQNKYPLLTVFVWGAVLGMMLKQKIRPIDVYTDIVFGLALAIGVQLLCNGTLEFLTNAQPKWDNQSTGAILSLHLWGLCLVLPSVLQLIDEKILCRVKQWGSAGLTVAAVIVVAVFLAKADLSPISVVTKDDEFVLSADENVVVFLVDSLDAQYVEDYVLAEDMRVEDEEAEAEAEAEELSREELFEKWLEATRAGEPFFEEEEEHYVLDEDLSHALLDDFTYFDNVVSGAAPNTISVPTLLTGERFPVDPERMAKYNGNTVLMNKDLEQYHKDAYARSSLFSDLRENGYNVRLYSDSNLLEGVDAGQIDNIRTDIPFRQKSFGTSLKNMFQLSAYYAMPYQAKQAFWISSNDIAKNTEMASTKQQRYDVWDTTFYQDFLNKGISLEKDGKDFVVYHLRGAAAPYRMDEECNSVAEADTSLSRQVAGVFRMIGEYVEEMKAEGVYDNSTIIIAGANGDLELGQNPAVFIKRRNEKRHFTVDSRPLTFANLRSSFVDGIVADAQKEYGYNMFNQLEDKAPVLREHVAGRNQWKQLYSENGAEWRTFMIMDEARGQEHILKTVESEPYPYTLDEWIPLCGYDDMTDKIRITGLSGNEQTFRWTQGQDITMSFALEEPQEDVLFRMDCLFTIDGAQRVLAYVNNHPVYNEVVGGSQWIQFAIPKAYAPEGIYDIVLKLPDAVSPVELGINEDTRLLSFQVTGCALCTFTEESFYPYRLNQWISLCGEDMVRDFPVSGLSGNEGEFQWTAGKKMRMGLWLIGPAKDVFFQMDCKGTFNGSQRVQIYANDHLVFDDAVTGSSCIQCEIPKEYAPRGYYDVIIRLPDAISPAEVGVSEDPRVLALQLTGVRLAVAEAAAQVLN